MSALVLTGFAVGFVLAAQVGPVTLLIVRSVLRGGRAIAVGLAMAAAVALIDLLYATLGIVGLGRVLSGGSARLAFGLASAAILVTIGVRTIWVGLRARMGLEVADEVVVPRRAFATAIAATALNPLTIALWTVSFPAAAPAAAASSPTRSSVLLIGAAFGTLTWYGGFAATLALMRKRLGRRLLRIVDVGTGCGLLAFGGVLGYRSVHEH